MLWGLPTGRCSTWCLTRNKPVDLLIVPGLKAGDFNDDTLGMALNELYEAGIIEVFTGITHHALKAYKVEHKSLHLDSRSFHVHGANERDCLKTRPIRGKYDIIRASIVLLQTESENRQPCYN